MNNKVDFSTWYESVYSNNAEYEDSASIDRAYLYYEKYLKE